jgi:diguanylate cyclase (GGDEF)-like protein
MAMDTPNQLGKDGLEARVNALRFAAVDFHEDVPGAEESVRRLSRSLQMPDCADRYPEVSAIAAILAHVEGHQLAAHLQRFLPILRGIATNLKECVTGILCVEDDVVAQQLITHRLAGSGLEIHMAATLAEAERYLVEYEISLILLDLGLPDGDGRDLLLRLRENPATTAIPVIVLSSKEGHQAQMECLALGANNFISKPIDPVMISMRVTAELERSAEIMRRSLLDRLTGVPNRTAFCSALTRASALAFRSGQSLSVAILSLDHLKTINALYGSAMGAEVLSRMATVVARFLRTSDMIGRWSSDEFAAYLPDTQPDQARMVFEKILTAFSAENFITKDRVTFQATFSAGIAQVSPNTPIEQAIVEADVMLYKAKTAGRGQCKS